MKQRNTIILVLVATACANPISRAEQRAIEQAERLWNARPFTDYTFEARYGEFPPRYDWVRVTVRGGSVVAAQIPGADTLLPDRELNYWRTIDSVFAGLHFSSQSRDLRKYCRDMELEFDASLGFPTRIECMRPLYRDGRPAEFFRNVQPVGPDKAKTARSQ